MAVHTVNEEWFENKKAVMLDDRKLAVFFYRYAEKYCCKIYKILLVILVASKNVNLQKFCKSIITFVL